MKKLPDLHLALRFYWEKSELTTADIRQLFGVSNSTATRMKKPVFEMMASSDPPIRTWTANAVNTKTAYEVWGLNIGEIETRLRKLKELEKAGVITE